MKRITAAWLLGLASLSACGSKVPPLTEQEKTVVKELTTNMQPRCVGRYLIDLPTNVAVVGSARFDGVGIEAKPQLLQAFELEMRRREAELTAAKSIHGYPRILFDHGEVRNSKHTKYFISLGDPTEFNDARRMIEAYKWDGGYRISLRIEASDWTDSKFKDEPIIKNDPVKTNVPEKKRLAFDLIDRLQGRSEDSIPNEPGSCFAGGFLLGKAGSETEDISASFVLIDKPDASFNWMSLSNTRDSSDTLLPRIRATKFQTALKEAKGRVLRLESVDLPSGMKVDEALMEALSYAVPSVQGFQFTLEANYRGGAQSPFIAMDLNTASPNSLIESDQIKESSLSEAEAVAIWDKVSRTLRPRPNAF